MNSNSGKQPDQIARLVGGAIVGGAAAFVVAKTIKSTAAPAGALLAAILTIILHEALDAPVSQAVSELGL
jgi:hypothetical protein